MPATENESSKNDFQGKVFQWGLGLIVLGLVGLIMPNFGLQLWRLRRLGEMQWVVLVIGIERPMKTVFYGS